MAVVTAATVAIMKGVMSVIKCKRLTIGMRVNSSTLDYCLQFPIDFIERTLNFALRKQQREEENE